MSKRKLETATTTPIKKTQKSTIQSPNYDELDFNLDGLFENYDGEQESAESRSTDSESDKEEREQLETSAFGYTPVVPRNSNLMVDPSFTFTNEASNDIANEERPLSEEDRLLICSLFDEDSASENGSTDSSNSNDETNHQHNAESFLPSSSGIVSLVGAILTYAVVSSHS